MSDPTTDEINERYNERGQASIAIDAAYRGIVERLVSGYLETALLRDAEAGLEKLRKGIRVASAVRRDALAAVDAELPDLR